MVVVYWAAVGGWRVMGAEEGKINICLVWDRRIGLGNNQANKNYNIKTRIISNLKLNSVLKSTING